MRDLSDLNDLYNAQDVIILLEIIENRFQKMQDKTGYNPRIINSASKLSGCIQREKSKIYIYILNKICVGTMQPLSSKVLNAANRAICYTLGF